MRYLRADAQPEVLDPVLAAVGDEVGGWVGGGRGVASRDRIQHPLPPFPGTHSQNQRRGDT